MSDEAFALPPAPMTSAETARDVVCACKAWSGQLAGTSLARNSSVAARDSRRWSTYSIALAQTGKGEAP